MNTFHVDQSPTIINLGHNKTDGDNQECTRKSRESKFQEKVEEFKAQKMEQELLELESYITDETQKEACPNKTETEHR